MANVEAKPQAVPGASSYGEWATRFRVPLGFALGATYLIFAQPTSPWLALGGGIALIGLWIRAWAAGCLDKNSSLAMGGPYAWTRNPLYLGSLLLGSGFVIAGRSIVLGIAFAALFLLVYRPVILREEAFLRARFGELYARYANEVPLLLPLRRRNGLKQGLEPRLNPQGGAFVARTPGSSPAFRWTRYRKNREYEAAAGYAAGILFLILKMALR